MEELKPSKHVLAASNPIYGPVNFIVLYMPPYWRASAVNIPPEIDEVRRFGAVQWVTSGSMTSLLYNPGIKVGLEVKVEVGRKPKLKGKTSDLKVKVGGHEANLRFRVEKVGLIRRKELDTLELEFYCEATMRYVRIKFRGLNAKSVFNEILKYIEGSICH